MTNEENPLLSVRQLKVLIVFFIVGDIAWFLPSLAASIVQQDAWVVALLGTFGGWAIAAFIFWFGSKFPGKTLVEIHRVAAGKWIGGLLTMLFVLSMFASASAQVRAIGQFITTQIMTETPMRVILFFFAMIIVMALMSGLDAITRTAQVFFMLFIALFVILVFLLLGDIDFRHLMPVMDHTVADFARGSLLMAIFPYAQMTAFLMIFPSVKKEKDMFKHYMRAVMWGGLIIFILLLLSILALGAFLTEQQIYPTYTMAKKISIGDFLQRLEFILIISYVLSTFFKCVIVMYAAKHSLLQLFGIRDERTFAIPLGFVLFGFSYVMAPDIVFLNSLAPSWALWDLTSVELLLGAVYLLSLLRSKRKKGAAKNAP